MGLLGALPIIGDIIDKVVPDANEKMRMKMELAKLADAEAARESQERISQTEVNKAEAGSSSLFVAGWRPAVGWACVAGFSYTVIIAPISMALFGLETPPITETAFLRDVLLGMLGISVAARSIEKVKGVAQNTLTGASDSRKADQPSVPASSQDDTAKGSGQLDAKPRKKILGIAPWPF